VDNTNRDRATRKRYIDIAKKKDVSIRFVDHVTLSFILTYSYKLLLFHGFVGVGVAQ
jgi:hypothetical protein